MSVNTPEIVFKRAIWDIAVEVDRHVENNCLLDPLVSSTNSGTAFETNSGEGMPWMTPLHFVSI